MIKFLCPNGHPLSAPENLVGKPGKCPKCQSAFIVPQPEPEEHEDTSVDVGSPAASPSAPASAPHTAEKAGGDTAVGSASSGSEIATGVAMDSPSGKGGVSGKSKASGELFVFLCPNGHRLNGPPTLKGKPGQCPHCGAKFRIPADDDLEEPEAGLPVDDEIPAGEAVDDEIPAGTLDEEAAEATAEEVYDPPVEPVPPGLHALCYILGRLWDRKTEDQILEIYTNEGEILSPDYYSEILSTADYAVFAMVDGDAYAVTVTPWSTVRKIAVKRVKTISPNVFR